MIAFSIWPVDIHRYGIMYLIAFVLGYLFAQSIKNRKLRDQTPHLQKILQHQIDDLIFVIFIGVMVGGRLWHVLIYDFHYFVEHPSQIIAFWKWWMSFIGWLIAVITIIITRTWKQWCSRSETKSLGDTILSFVPLGIFFGRIGNFLNQELYGIIVPSNMRNLPQRLTTVLTKTHIRHIYDHIDTALRVNTNMLAALGEWLLLFSIGQYLLYRQKKTNKLLPGQITGVFLVWYSTIRFILEYLRQDSQQEFIGYFSKSQYFFIIFIIVWLLRLVYIYRQFRSSLPSQKVS